MSRQQSFIAGERNSDICAGGKQLCWHRRAVLLPLYITRAPHEVHFTISAEILLRFRTILRVIYQQASATNTRAISGTRAYALCTISVD